MYPKPSIFRDLWHIFELKNAENKLNMVSWMDALSGDRDVLSDIAASTYHTEVSCPKIIFAFPQTGLPVGFYLRRKDTGHSGGRAVLCWARIWLC